MNEWSWLLWERSVNVSRKCCPGMKWLDVWAKLRVVVNIAKVGGDLKVYVCPFRKVLRKRVLGGTSPIWCCPERWSGLNRISHPLWVKTCVYPNGQINLHTKQKYEVLSAMVKYLLIVQRDCRGDQTFFAATLYESRFVCAPPYNNLSIQFLHMQIT